MSRRDEAFVLGMSKNPEEATSLKRIKEATWLRFLEKAKRRRLEPEGTEQRDIRIFQQGLKVFP